jgi:hypothetical protein
MRTIVDFSLFSNQGFLISIEDLGKIGTTASLVGYVIEPLPSEIRQAIFPPARIRMSSAIHIYTDVWVFMLQ